MEYRYYRELKHNYLIVQQDNDIQEKIASYQTRILEKGKLSGFLTCNMRTINNENYLYYEINSMQNIRDRFSVKGMDAEQLTRLLSSLKDALESLSEYLLGMENVVLDTKSVFTDLSTGEFKFMYCPFKKEQADFAGFIEELVDLIDHEDDTAVEMIYSCSEKAEMDSMLVLDCIDQVLEGKRYEKTQVEYREQPYDTHEFIEFDDSSHNLDEDEKEEEDVRKHKAKCNSGKLQIIFGILFLVLLAAMMYVRMNYILSREENILSIIVIVVSVVTGLVAFINGFKDAKIAFPWKKENKKDIKPLEELDEDEFYDQIDGGRDYGDEENQDAYVDVESYRKIVNVTSYNKKPRSVANTRLSCGETVVLSQEDNCDKAHTLYSRNTDRTIRIPLDNLPLTVGKMEGCVDKVLDDMSVSRIHCRFIQNKEGGVSLVDLNSTNGTFRNGLKITPQKEICIEEGDEVRIGRICFDCR